MDDNQDALELKRRARRRLVGAIALVVLVVIVLPIVFDNEPKTITQDLIIQIPSQDAGKFSTRAIAPPTDVSPAGSGRAAETIPPAATASIPANPSQSSAMAKAAPAEPRAEFSRESALANSGQPIKAEAAKSAKPVQKSETKTAQGSTKLAATAGPAPSQGSADDAGQGTYFVPLGSFGKPENVRVIQSKVSAAGFKSFAEKSAGSGQTRVRAGPFPTRESAENAREKLKNSGVDVGPVSSR